MKKIKYKIFHNSNNKKECHFKKPTTIRIREFDFFKKAIKEKRLFLSWANGLMKSKNKGMYIKLFNI